MKINDKYTDQELSWFAAIGIDLCNMIHFGFDGLHSVTFDATRVSVELRQRALMFGLTNKIKDTAAIKKDASNQYTITESMRRVKVVEMIDHLESGTDQWNLKSSGRAAPQNPVFLAIATKFGITYDEAMAKVQDEMLGEI